MLQRTSGPGQVVALHIEDARREELVRHQANIQAAHRIKLVRSRKTSSLAQPPWAQHRRVLALSRDRDREVPNQQEHCQAHRRREQSVHGVDQEALSRIHSRDERIYCPYCDMKNHPRWTCKYADRHCVEGANCSCSLCIGAHPPSLCPRARCNQGPGQPDWAII